MKELKLMVMELVEVVVTIFTGTTPANQLIFQEIKTEWWKDPKQKPTLSNNNDWKNHGRM